MKKGMTLKRKVLFACLAMVLFPILLIFVAFYGLKWILTQKVTWEAASAFANPDIAQKIAVYLIFIIVIILIVMAFFMRRFILQGLIQPINDLSLGMKHIKDGNFDYQLPNYSSGELGVCFESYEQMRMRLKETTQIAIENEQKNRELISNISHDLKTPITAIKGYMEGIMDGIADTPEKMDRYIKTVYNKAQDMDRLINELTLYSKIDSNRIPYNFHRINVCEYFRDCVEEVGLDLKSKSIEFNFYNLVSEDTQIIADPEQLRRVINNIISNSVKYMDTKPDEQALIEIRILDQIDSIHIELEDNGKGISQKDLPRIFERFYRTDASRNSTKGGSGIGLSIVKKIVEDHGGYIWATSKEGEGTCMHIVIRKYDESQNVAE